MQFKAIAITALSMIVTLAVASPSLTSRQEGDLQCAAPALWRLCCAAVDGPDIGVDCVPLGDSSECLDTAVCCETFDDSDATGCILPNSSD